MKLVLGMIGLLAVTLVAPLRGGSVDCVSQERCPEGQTPPNCCAPPPCEIHESLKLTRAMRRMMSGDRPAKALAGSHGNHSVAIAVLQKWNGDEFQAIKSQSKCSPGKLPYAAPDFRLTQSCGLEVMRASGWSAVANPMSLPQEFDMCNELVEAAYERAVQLQKLCGTGERSDVHWWAATQGHALQKNIDSMMMHLQRYWSACSSVMDEGNRRQLEEAELTMEDPKPHIQQALQLLMQMSTSRH